MRPLRARRAKIVPVPALVDRKTGAGPKVDVGRKVDVDRKVDAVRKTDVVLKVDAVRKADVVRKTGAVRKADVDPKVVAGPDDVRNRAWSSLSVQRSPVARSTRRGSRLQAFQFGRLRHQNRVAVLVVKDPMVPAAVPVAQAVRLRVVIANCAICANRGRHTSKFFTSSACFSM
jgi:hypothetical protein